MDPMNVNTDVNTNPAAAPTPEGAPAPETATPEGAAPAEGGEGGEPAPYEPNFKFKVMEQEHEIDEMFRSLVKDADTEKKIRELHEKAYGLDTVKGRLEKVREEHTSTKQKLSQYEEAVSDLRELYQSRDFDTFFGKLNIPQEAILQWVAEKVNYNNLPPEQKALYDDALKARRDAYEARKQSREMSGKVDERSLEARRVLMTTALEKPDVKTFAAAFNAKVGKPDAFWNEVCKVGIQAHEQDGIDLPPEEAIKRVMDAYKPFFGEAAPAGNPAAANQPKVVQPNPAPTIPNVQGSAGRSPVGKKKPTSIEDLKKLAAGQTL
jgi:hypothetical protein